MLILQVLENLLLYYNKLYRGIVNIDTLSKQSGITLTEIVIGIVIIVILTVVAIPNVINILKNHRLSAEAENFYSKIQLARAEAIKRNTTVYLSFTTGSNWCYGVNPGSACDCTNASSCSLGAVTPNAANQTTLSASGYGSNYVSFESIHGAANNSGSITFTTYQGSNLVTLSIGRLGNVQMCATGLSGYTPC